MNTIREILCVGVPSLIVFILLIYIGVKLFTALGRIGAEKNGKVVIIAPEEEDEEDE